MYRTINIGDHAWGGVAENYPFNVSTIDDEVGSDLYSAAYYTLQLEMDITTGVGADFTTQEQLEWWSVLLKGGPFAQPVVSEVNLWDLVIYLMACEGVPQYLFTTTDAEATNQINQANIIIPYASNLLEFPEEHWPLASMAAKQQFRLHYGVAAPQADVTVNAASASLSCRLYRGHSPRFAHPRCIESFDKELRETFPAGTYHGNLAIGPWEAAADISNVRMVADGVEYHSSIEADDLVAAYYADAGYQATQGALPLDGVAGLEQWDQISFEKNYDTIPFLPFIWLQPDFRSNRMSQLVGCQQGLLMDLDGDADDLHYVIGYVPPVGATFAQRAAGAIGADPKAVLVDKEIKPEDVKDRPALQAAPFRVVGATNISRSGRLAVTLRTNPLGGGSRKMANRNL